MTVMAGRGRALRHIRQANLSSGCGPACVAMVARCSYAQAVRAMFPDGRRNSYYSFWADIRRALDVLGVPYGERARRCETWERIPETAIVACGGLPGIFWHWVVYDPRRRTVHDPLRSGPAPLTRIRRRPFSYLAVQPPP